MHAQAQVTSPIVLEGAAWLGTEGSDAPLQLLATAAAGRKWILTLTPADIRRIELGIPALPENLEIIRLCQPPLAQVLEMIDLGIGTLLQASSVEFEEGLAPLVYRLSPHYPTDRAQPGRSITIAEIAVARAERLGKNQVTRGDLASVVADASGASMAQLLREDDERFHSLEARLSARVVGHEDARKKIANVLRRGYAGFRGKRPLASFLLLGPTGVGKTETARAIADALFDGETALLRIDLSEFSEPHSIARLIGAPPGYLGHEQGGQLTEALRRRPAQVVLLDEMEKAHRDVQLLLLQVLEDGRLTDGRGRTVDFSSSVIVMTSNLGSECYRHTRDPSEATILALARSRLPSELWNRIDEVLCYAPLSESDLAAIVTRIARASSDRLYTERAIRFHIDPSVVAAILRIETDRSLGARPLRRAFERMIEGPIANEIVAGRLRPGVEIKIRCLADDRLDFALLR
jgi:ATP-dependent Clp protease ATP-binding subunit ClpC